MQYQYTNVYSTHINFINISTSNQVITLIKWSLLKYFLNLHLKSFVLNKIKGFLKSLWLPYMIIWTTLISNMMSYQTKIVADYREIPSKIPDILREREANVELQHLKTGDYIINEEIIIERKSRDDFVLSIIQSRLFSQCQRLKKAKYFPVVLIEGNPYHTEHNIDRRAIKGALLSISVSWQIPVMYSANANDSADMLLMAGKQLLQDDFNSLRRAYKPRRLKNKALYFLQGLPTVGSATAKALLEKFGSLENIILATEEELKQIEGLGKVKIEKIRRFLGMDYRKSIK